MRRTGTRPLGVAALCATLLIGAGAARADDVMSLDANITAMDRNVIPIDDRVTEGGPPPSPLSRTSCSTSARPS